MEQPQVSQPVENKISSLRRLTRPKTRSLRLLSSKSIAKIRPETREDMVAALIENPDPESITRKFGSTAIQIVFGVLWVLAIKVRRLELRTAQTRNGFGRPVVAPIAREGKSAARATSAGLTVLGDAA